MSKILILDFGSQYTNLLAKAIRGLSVYCEVVPWDIPACYVRNYAPSGIIFSGGPHTVYADDSPSVDQEIYQCQIPILGVCYGMQLIARDFGGEVRTLDHEFGYTSVKLHSSHLFSSVVKDKILNAELRMSHCDSVTVLPDGFSVIASTEKCPIAAMENLEKQIFGLQFHPEVSDSNSFGREILEHFVVSICQSSRSWDVEHIEKQLVETIRKQIGDERVLLGLSGGVDSLVAATLLHKAIGSQLICVLVDTGLLRENEAEEVRNQCKAIGIELIVENAAAIFFKNLAGIHDPEEKRKRIGKTFIDVFEKIAAASNVQWLSQGTIYSDVIESAQSGSATQVIKSHHNVGGLPERLQLKLIEPLRCLFKDEVRRLGSALGLPDQLINRHPFPGPGLGIRVVGEVLPDFVEIVRKADMIFLEELQHWGITSSQAFAIFLPVRSVAVKGDCRCYGYTIALRIVESEDFMTARWSELPRSLLNQCSTRIINEIPEVSRVVYDISDKPPATIEWE